MTYLRSKRFIAFLILIFLFFEGAITLPFKFFPKRREKDIRQELTLLYQKIGDLELKLKEKQNNFSEEMSANIIFGGGYIFSDTIFLDKGTESGVESGNLVVYKSAIAIAQMEEVFSGYSKAAPFSRFGRVVSLRSGEDKKILFEAKGVGGRESSAILPKGSGVKGGDSAYLAEDPRFLVGVVESAEKKESRDFDEIRIVVPLSLRSIAGVNIEKKYVKER